MLAELIARLPKSVLERPQFLEPDMAALCSIGLDVFGREQRLVVEASQAFLQMQADALRQDVDFKVVSAFRSIDYQTQLIEKKLAQGQLLSDIIKVSALPGYSEHHSGRAVDLTCDEEQGLLTEAFEKTRAFVWLSSNAVNYGFSMSYPRGNADGYIYEPWHWCYHSN